MGANESEGGRAARLCPQKANNVGVLANQIIRMRTMQLLTSALHLQWSQVLQLTAEDGLRDRSIALQG